MAKKTINKGVVYTVVRNYKGTYSVDELINSIIQSHYYEEEENTPHTTDKETKSA